MFFFGLLMSLEFVLVFWAVLPFYEELEPLVLLLNFIDNVSLELVYVKWVFLVIVIVKIPESFWIIICHKSNFNLKSFFLLFILHLFNVFKKNYFVVFLISFQCFFFFCLGLFVSCSELI